VLKRKKEQNDRHGNKRRHTYYVHTTKGIKVRQLVEFIIFVSLHNYRNKIK
jgi:hypothetical protein